MFKGMFHTHVTFVFIYIIIYVVKVYLLLSNQHEALAKFRAKTKVIGEMIIPVIFLATGVFLALNSGDLGTWFYLKMALLVISIPLGVIAFRKNSKGLALMVLLLFALMMVLTYSRNKMASTNNVTSNSIDGKTLFETNCVKCHGQDGALGKSGSANLQMSKLEDEDIRAVIMNGKNMMPANPGNMNTDQINAVVDYIKTLRK